MTTVNRSTTPARVGRKPLTETVRFVVFAYLASWTVGGVAFVALDLGEVGLAIGVLMVAVVALALTRRDQGSMRPMWRAILRWRVPAASYVAAIGLPLVLVGAAVAITGAIGGVGLESDPAGPAILLLLPLYVLLLGGPEEPGWRGYALPRLQTRFDALTSSLIIGAVWLGWHLPLFMIDNPLFSVIPLGAYGVMAVASSVVYTWLYNSSRGSVLLAMILHGATNLSLVWVGDHAAWYALAGLWVLVAIGLIAWFGARDLAAHPRHTGADRTAPVG